jgi:deoxyribodipyrimidine photo-lyase
MVQPERLTRLNDAEPRPGRFVLYWMQQSQRAACNHALEHAVREADRLRLPVLAAFALTARFPEAQERHYAFMLEGLSETKEALLRRGVDLAVAAGSPPRVVPALARDAALLVTDVGHLRVQREWRAAVAARVRCPAVAVESDVVVPVGLVSDHEEYAARTIRPKVHAVLDRFLVPLEETRPRRDSIGMAPRGGVDISDVDGAIARLRVARRARRVSSMRGGTTQARRRLRAFLAKGLARYAEAHGDPGADAISHLSPYLHFGQISPLEVALAVRDAAAPAASREAFLEELVVRRELSMNFCAFNRAYDAYGGLPEWARGTLAKHARDRRPYRYAAADLERARTHDPWWNAAQREMVATGFMHSYMRMYWGKKIIEWTEDPVDAFYIALRLNNTYQMDGRDPNSFAGVAWCFGKHDRPWGERPVFGMVRWMSADGLRRKFDMDAYVRRVA